MKFTKEDTSIIKTWAIFLMLYHHLFAFPGRIKYNIIPIFVFNNVTSSFYIGAFGKICVAIFMFLGGYGIYKSYVKHRSDCSFLKRKIHLLYDHYISIFLFVIIVGLLFNLDFGNNSIISMVLNISGISTTYVREWWFFTAYVVLLLLTPIIIKIINSKYFNLMYSICIVIILNSLIIIVYPKIYRFLSINLVTDYKFLANNILPAFYYLPIYLLGMIFAKYDILDIIKKYVYGKYIYSLLSLFLITLLVILRYKTGYVFEFIYVVLFVIGVMIITNSKIFSNLNKLLLIISKQNTNIWLLHTFYCYKLFPKIIYAPKYTILIFLWLLGISYFTGLIIDYVGNLMYKIYDIIYVNIKKGV